MGLRVDWAFLSETHEADLIEKYSACCEVPVILAIYSLDDANPLHQEGFFVCYACAVCQSNLYPESSEIAHTKGCWI